MTTWAIASCVWGIPDIRLFFFLGTAWRAASSRSFAAGVLVVDGEAYESVRTVLCTHALWLLCVHNCPFALNVRAALDTLYADVAQNKLQKKARKGR